MRVHIQCGFAVLAIFWSFISAASDSVKFIDKHGFIVENQITTAQPVEQVWQALTNDVDQWWPKDHSWWYGEFSIEPVAGGCFCETHENNSAEHMRIVFVEHNKTLRMSGGLGPLQGMGMVGALDWQFAEADGITTVTLTYRVHGIDANGFEALAPIVGQVQGIQLNALKTFIERQ
ncbi:SRPBCC domain-containing protein [Alteromonas sp. ASW11-36]|uniref:SRPBCC domain-containing protein n=1 Tax=Alteromonas arenosi TaxID=3055817 RepID=A0ABT7SZU4_9ALTE|nr:SRPBCC domain-containing protein [Alteromonas sp. ASW11-36]MDM7861711.1 SRPBCC domain-containing protein [Alteromonas sp. ASW11-36]